MNITLADIESTAPETAWRRVASFRVLGEPKAQPRPRAFAKKFGATFTARVYTPGTAEAWKSCIAIHAQRHLPASPITGAVRLDAIVLFPRPGRLLKKKSPQGRIPHTAKPDVDNLAKAIFDTIVTLGFIVDDSQICASEIMKYYKASDEQAGAIISIWEAIG